MSYADNNPYRSWGMIAADAQPNERLGFIRKTYMHLAGAVLALVALEAVLLNAPFTPDLISMMVGNRFSWLIVFGVFMGVTWMANSMAQSNTSPRVQYAGLGLYIVAEAVIFLPLLYIANQFGDGTVIPTAGLITLLLFGGLTAIVFMTGADFSFLRTGLMIAGLAALGLMLCSALFGFNMGVLFTVAMIALMCGYILYDTSNVLHHYHIGQHVAASLALFATIVTLFWYILQLVMSLNRR